MSCTWLIKEKNCKHDTHSWSWILLGSPIVESEWNRVLRCISFTSAFLLIASVSFSPDVRWVHIKQNSVWYIDMLTDIEPCKIEEKSQLLQDGEVLDVMRDMKVKIKQVIISKIM